MTENNEEFEYAGFWMRVWACLIDIFLYSIFLLIIAILNLFFSDSTDKHHYHLTIGWQVSFYDSSQSVVDNLRNFSFSMLPVFVVIFFWIYYQATPGKMAIRGKIVDARTGNKPSTAQFIGRCFSYIPSILIFGMGIFWIVFDRKKQGWHDKLAGTVVIKEKKYVQDVQFKTE